MDDIDFKINLLLMLNSRLSYREIADHLGLTVSAVYKRVQALVESRIIQKFTARIKPAAVSAIYTFIFGECKVADMNQVVAKLGNHQNTAQIILSSRNYMYIGGYLKDIHELDEYSSFISQVGKIESPTIGFLHRVYSASPIQYTIPKPGSPSLDELDRAIIRALHNDSRKPLFEVSEIVNRTSNTVRRRLDRLIEEGWIDLTINFNPISSTDIFSLFQITLKPSVDKHEFAQFIYENYQPNIFFIWTFSNLPNLITCFVWCNTMKQLHEMIDELKNERVESIITDVLYDSLFFETWIDELFM